MNLKAAIESFHQRKAPVDSQCRVIATPLEASFARDSFARNPLSAFFMHQSNILFVQYADTISRD